MILKIILITTFTLLWVLDTVFTSMFVTRYGLEAEANVIVSWVIQHCDMIGFYFFKSLTWSFLIFANCIYYIKYNKILTCWIDMILITLMLPVVYLGFLLIR